MNIIWPKKLYSPHVALGSSIDSALLTLKALDGTIEETLNEDTHSFSVNTPEFGITIYENKGIVAGVWYNDALGRLWPKGKTLKIDLYLQRFGSLNEWEMTLDNGWMRYYSNKNSGALMVYGIHKDVIRFNLQQST
ncbi:hypothetical protein M0C34_08855 [Agarivorans sp. TSD2052]|uniref:hypothetical protein n=1 Tax=Agarivorans sp. TSD2052 TaxID=2937286 RepID=UPI00200BF183|nr:hypothetical protein [Agarivorans sp. TSD2052]UPW20353.1 hypothetical protein M0C34_08855 [Agarivorans sp. TSD2052]